MKYFCINRHSIIIVVILLLTLTIHTNAFGYDSANACSPNGKLSRRGRAQLIKTIPCDLSQQAFCNLPGSAYPWHAVRRFVHENQGLMKRMYGDVRHISILRDEIQNNEIDIEDVQVAAARYSKDGGARRLSKYMHVSDDYSGIKSNDVLKEPHFRPVSPRTTSTTTTPNPKYSRTNKTNTDPDGDSSLGNTISVHNNELKLTNALQGRYDGIDNDTSELNSLEDDFDINSADDDDDNLESNSVYGAPTLLGNGENIRMVEPPKFGIALNNFTQAATISTTLKKVTNTQRIAAINEPLRKPQTQHPVQTQYQQQLVKKQQQSNSQTQQQQPINKVNLTILKESSMVKIKLNESERITTASVNAKKSNNNTMSLTTVASATANKITTTNTTSATTTAATIVAGTQLPQPAVVKGAALGSSNASTTPLKSNINKNTYTNDGEAEENRNGTQPETTTTTTIRTTSVLTTSSPTLPSSSTPPQSDSSTTTKTTTTYTMRPTTASMAASTTSAGLNASVKPQLDLLLGEKLQRPTASTTPATQATPSTKPVLRDGQLFQDTIKQEPPPILNARGVNACPVKEEVVAPFWANNTRGEVLALLNLYPFEQYVHWEKCVHEHKQMYCRDGCRCEQQYRLHRLLAYDPHNECRGIFSDWFRFPSSCICKCYDIPLDFRATSRSPRSEHAFQDVNSEYDDENKHPIEKAEEVVKNAIYEHATEDWYRPRDEHYLFDD